MSQLKYIWNIWNIMDSWDNLISKTSYTETFEFETNELLPRYHVSHQKITWCSSNDLFQLAQTLWPSLYPQFSQKTGLEVQNIYLAHWLKLWGNYVQLKFWDNWNIYFHCTTACTQTLWSVETIEYLILYIETF